MVRFSRGCLQVAVPAEQGVVFALRKSPPRSPFVIATVDLDQRCHKGLPLRLPMVLAEECFGGCFSMCLECIVFQGFRLRAAVRATLIADFRADIKDGQYGRTPGAAKGAKCSFLANAASRTGTNQLKMPRSRLATR